MSITAIIVASRCPEIIAEQVGAIRGQSVEPAAVWAWADDPTPEVCAALADAVAAMTCALSDVAEVVRVDAAEALAEVGPPAVDAISALREMTAADSSAMVRLKAAWALWRICHWPRSLDKLVESMRDPCSDVRIEAIKALRAMGASASPAVEAIENAMGDDDVYVREFAKDAMQMLESDTGRWN